MEVKDGIQLDPTLKSPTAGCLLLAAVARLAPTLLLLMPALPVKEPVPQLRLFRSTKPDFFPDFVVVATWTVPVLLALFLLLDSPVILKWML